MATIPPSSEENNPEENKAEPKRGSMTSWIFGKSNTHSNASSFKQPSRPLTAEDMAAIRFSAQYDMLEMIGYGGMGSVYKVRDRQRGGLFALKILHSELAKQPGAVKRFEQEATSASQLTHPNLVAVYQHGLLKEGQPYLLMDYVEGESLAHLLSKEKYLDTHQVTDIFLQVAEAVKHAHDKGVIHRDLKPSNILLTKAENGSYLVKLVDFGIAKVLTPTDKEMSNLTQSGEIFGSPQYMSPEQCLGDQLDCRADLYSLGCVMYESLTGKPPFTANNPIKLVFKHINDAPPALLRPLQGHEISPGLKTIVMRCLEKDPADRYQSASELVRDLTLVQDGKPIEQPKKKKKTTKKGDSRPIVASAAAAVVLLFAVAALMQGPLLTFFIKDFGPGQPKTESGEQASFIRTCTMQIASHANDDSWYVMRGTAYREAGEYEKSLADFNKAIELNPHNAKTFRARAWTYNDIGDGRNSLKDCNTALSIDPNCTDVYATRARAYGKLEEPENALKDYNKALAINPSDSAIYWGRGWLYSVTGQHEKALADFNQALKMQPDEKRVLVGRAMCYANLGQYENSEKDLSDYLIARPDHLSNTLWRRSLIYLADGKYQQALDDSQKVLTATPDNWSAAAVHALALAGLGKTEEAMNELNRDLQAAPLDPDNLEGRAQLYLRAKEYNKALIDLTKAIQARPKFLRALRDRAFVYGRLGNVESADTDLKAASSLSPFSF